MGNLFRMDLYRMVRAKAFYVCLGIAFLLALISAPAEKLLFTLAKTLSSEVNEEFVTRINLSDLLSEPFPMMTLLLLMLSLCYFYYADVENGYIKNIAGQMPMKGFTVLSKFLATAVHNLMFVAAAIIANVIGTLVVRQIVVDDQVLDSIRVLFLKLLLLQSLCAILLLMVATFRSKSLGMILAVLFGLGFVMPLIYQAINEGLKQIFGQDTNIVQYMPDVVMGQKPLDTVKAVTVAVITGVVFLLPAIRIFDRKDVK